MGRQLRVAYTMCAKHPLSRTFAFTFLPLSRVNDQALSVRKTPIGVEALVIFNFTLFPLSCDVILILQRLSDNAYRAETKQLVFC